MKGQHRFVGEHQSSCSGPAVPRNSLWAHWSCVIGGISLPFPVSPVPPLRGAETTASWPWPLPLCFSPLLSSDTQEMASQDLASCGGVPGPLLADIPWVPARQDSTRFSSHSLGFGNPLPGPGTNQRVFIPILK